MSARFGVAATGLLSLGFAVAGAFLGWYEFSLQKDVKIQLFQTHGELTPKFFSEPETFSTFLTNGTCTNCQSGSEPQNRWYGVIVAFIIGAVLSLLATGCSFPSGKRVAIARIVTMLLAAIAHCFAGSFGLFFIEYWYFDGKLPCESFGSQCSGEKIGLGLYFQLVATILNFIGLIVAAVALLQARQAEDDDEAHGDDNEPLSEVVTDGPTKPLPADDGTAAQQEPTHATQANTAPQPEDPQSATPKGDGGAAGEPELPDGDWVYDEESGMYWSDEAYLFLHLESGLFFDPNSGMWYNSETEEWFEPEE